MRDFRVWNTIYKKFYFKTLSEILSYAQDDWYYTAPFMDYIGKKDKNDVKIYEGDRVAFRFKPYECGDYEIHAGYVEYNDEWACYQINTGCEAFTFFDDIGCLEVVGNKYEDNK